MQFWLLFLVYCLPCEAISGVNLQETVDNFRESLQQQNFYSILTAIEERLRNLDNIYSIQLGQTLEDKLDRYHQKLEAIDAKVLRLESILTMQLDQISENVSTKNYKDDILKMNTYRKIDFLYEGLSHRLNHMDRKYDTNYDKLQEKLDSTTVRLQSLEQNMVQRTADIESDLSEFISMIDDFKPGTRETQNTTESEQNPLEETFIEKLRQLENKTEHSFNMALLTNELITSSKTELRGDFNEYASKVAEMGSDLWRNNDLMQNKLNNIQRVVNSTRIEIQNGVRDLMVQIGRTSTKANFDQPCSGTQEKDLNQSIEKILTNQDLFLESCHKVQMDESQIESEISVMLEKVVDMLENRMAVLSKDMKNVDKTIKNQDLKINRNIHQINANIIPMLDKNSRSSEKAEKILLEIKKILKSLLLASAQDAVIESQSFEGKNV
ncbi:uncharacterized protein LOC132696205 [Cylas formicarius]|uniref:uncharacterized protein LOC132696205 n=1 Tax=Cylas formicarius TaxID=197179 RepID=UPI002958905C|nr:uncharacterized protein LOC132696205 [Cylas formicarius]